MTCTTRLPKPVTDVWDWQMEGLCRGQNSAVFFHPDSNSLNLALPIDLESSPESLSAVVEIKAGATLLFVDSLDVQVFDGPPSATQIPTVLLDYVGPGNNMAVLTLIPDDTTIAFGDTLFFDATAEDSSAQAIPDFYVAWSTSNPAIATINAFNRINAATRQITGDWVREWVEQSYSAAKAA